MPAQRSPLSDPTLPPAIPAKTCAWLNGVSIASWWRWCKYNPDAPKPRKVGPRATRWLTAEVIAFRDRSLGGKA